MNDTVDKVFLKLSGMLARADDCDGRLPTERALARKLGTTRHVIRKALGQLEEEGRLWRHVGRGTFAGDRPAFDRRLSHVVIQHANPREIVETRKILEPQIAALAAARATTAQISAIDEACRRCASSRSMAQYEVWDERFHTSVTAATGSVLLQSLFETVNQARKKVVWGKMRRAALRPERRATLSAQHKLIFEAIRERNAEAAWNAMRAHVETIADVYNVLENAKGRHIQI